MNTPLPPKKTTSFGARLKGPVAAFVTAAYGHVQLRVQKDPADPVVGLSDTKLIEGLVAYGPQPAALVDLIYPPTTVAAENHMDQRKHAEPVAVPTETKAPSAPSNKAAPVSYRASALTWFALTALLTALMLAWVIVPRGMRTSVLEAQNKALGIRAAELENNSNALGLQAAELAAKNKALAKSAADLEAENNAQKEQMETLALAVNYEDIRAAELERQLGNWEAAVPKFNAKFAADRSTIEALRQENDQLRNTGK